MENRKPGLYAVFETTEGQFTCALYPDKAPRTVANFVGLARGEKEFTDERTRRPARRPFYDGLIFHRVISGFMIQGGCPLSTGTGGPGYEFEDEFSDELRFDNPGKLAMANSGPNTNGSQFFITVAPTDWLNNHHTIFGEVVEGQDVVNKIAGAPRDRQDKPRSPIAISTVKIVEAK